MENIYTETYLQKYLHGDSKLETSEKCFTIGIFGKEFKILWFKGVWSSPVFIEMIFDWLRHEVDRENYTNINEFFIAWPGFKFFSKATNYPSASASLLTTKPVL